MLAIDTIDVFGLNQLGQAPQAPVVPIAVPVPGVPPRGTSTVILPALPDNVAVRCRFDDKIGVWRCEHGGLFERPSTFVIIAGGLAIFAFGFFLGNLLPMRQVAALLARRQTA